VQRGTLHSRANRSDKPCGIVIVLLDGEFDNALNQMLDAGLRGVKLVYSRELSFKNK
jgi:hypothetical protein